MATRKMPLMTIGLAIKIIILNALVFGVLFLAEKILPNSLMIFIIDKGVIIFAILFLIRIILGIITKKVQRNKEEWGHEHGNKYTPRWFYNSVLFLTVVLNLLYIKGTYAEAGYSIVAVLKTLLHFLGIEL